MLRSARQALARASAYLIRHPEGGALAQESRIVLPCAAVQAVQSLDGQKFLYSCLSPRHGQANMCDINRRTQHHTLKRPLSTVIYPPSEARVGEPAPDFKADGTLRRTCYAHAETDVQTIGLQE